MRNALLYNLSQVAGCYAPRVQFAEVFFVQDGKEPNYKDHYFGVYMITEPISVDKDRVNIKKDEGIIFESDWAQSIKKDQGKIVWLDSLPHDGLDWTYWKYQAVWQVDHDIDSETGKPRPYPYIGSNLTSQGIVLDYPDADSNKPLDPISIDTITYLQNFQNNLFDERIYSDKDKGYYNYIDVDSWVDYLILNEITNNADSYRHSTYMHRNNKDSKIIAGPVWDYDIGFGNVAYGLGPAYDMWRFSLYGTELEKMENSRMGIPGYGYLGTAVWFQRLWSDPNFRLKVKKRWAELRKKVFSDSAIKSIIDYYYNYLTQKNSINISAINLQSPDDLDNSAMRGQKRWPSPYTGEWMTGKSPEDCKLCKNNLDANFCCQKIRYHNSDDCLQANPPCFPIKGSILENIAPADKTYAQFSPARPWNSYPPSDSQSTRPLKNLKEAVYSGNGKLHAQGSGLWTWLQLRLEWMDNQLLK